MKKKIGMKKNRKKSVLSADGIVACLMILAVILSVFRIYGIVPYIVMSGSMEPAIPTGSLCFVNMNAEYDSIEKGDIIAFSTGGGMKVTHRVFAVDKDGIRTKGDGNEKTDRWVITEKNYEGKTIMWIPYVGYVFRIIHDFFLYILQSAAELI